MSTSSGISTSSELDVSYRLAVSELRACYDKLGIVAGRRNYADYWTRDAYYGWLGALAIGNAEIVKKHLTLIAKHQKKNGLLPYLIRQQLPGFPFIGIHKQITPIPCFSSPKALFASQVVDSNFYYIAGVHDYFTTTKQVLFVKKHLPNILAAFSWYTKALTKEGLLEEGYIAQWNDGIYKSGFVAITNMQVYQAAVYTAQLLRVCKKDPTPATTVADRVLKAIRTHFWNGSYFTDWIKHNQSYNFFDSIANLLAVCWNISDKKMSSSILHFVEHHAYHTPLVSSNYPSYPTRIVEMINKFFGVGSYWQGSTVFWIEPTLLYCQALKKTGQKAKAKKVLADVSTLIASHSGIYETYSHIGTTFAPFKTKWYASEHPYARGAGMYLATAKLDTSK